MSQWRWLGLVQYCGAGRSGATVQMGDNKVMRTEVQETSAFLLGGSLSTAGAGPVDHSEAGTTSSRSGRIWLPPLRSAVSSSLRELRGLGRELTAQ